MKPRRALRVFVSLWPLIVASHLWAEQPLPAATVVVFNRDLPESVELAHFYAEARGIPADHLVGLACSPNEEISRPEYDATIARPLRDIFAERKWWSLREVANGPPAVATTTIRFVALIKGVPLKIAPATDYPGDETGSGPIANRNEASVDSELAGLGWSSPKISGALTNPYFQSYRAIGEFESAAILLVCRLDAPTAAAVRRMITDGIQVENAGLWGRAYVDAGHNAGGLAIGDGWLTEIAKQLRRAGVPVIFDEAPEIFPEGYPITDCALYYGWYAGVVSGAFANPAFRFLPGAIAVHIHSFSAATLRDANSGWAGPLLARGAAATLGNVYEPYLQLTTHLDLFNDRLLHGFTFAESAYMATPTLSWMDVMVGDPLYRPYVSWLQLDRPVALKNKENEWRMIHEFTSKNGGRPPAEFRLAARQTAARARNAAMLEDLGGSEMREGNFAVAATYFQQARALYPKRDDILRVALEEADAWIKQGKPKRALELVRGITRVVSDAPALPLLRKIEAQLSGPVATPTPGAQRSP